MMLGPMYYTFLEMLGVAVRMLKSLISVFFFCRFPLKKGVMGKVQEKKEDQALPREERSASLLLSHLFL